MHSLPFSDQNTSGCVHDGYRPRDGHVRYMKGQESHLPPACQTRDSSRLGIEHCIPMDITCCGIGITSLIAAAQRRLGRRRRAHFLCKHLPT